MHIEAQALLAKSEEETMINETLIREVVAAIEDNESGWDQRYWVNEAPCGTTFCFAGWATLLAGHIEETAEGVRTTAKGKLVAAGLGWSADLLDGRHPVNTWFPFLPVAAAELGLTYEQAKILFDEGNDYLFIHPSIEQFKDLITQVTGVTFSPDPKDKPEPVVPRKEIVPFPSDVPELVAA